MAHIQSHDAGSHLQLVYSARSHWIIISDCERGDRLLHGFALAMVFGGNLDDDDFGMGQFVITHPGFGIKKDVTFLTVRKSKVRKEDVEALAGEAQGGRRVSLTFEQDLLPLTHDDPTVLVGMFDQLVRGMCVPVTVANQN